MKKIFIATLLTAFTAFPQDKAADPPSVSYAWVTPDCSGVEGLLNQFSSGCWFKRLKVTAKSSNPRVSGFFILATYRDADGKDNFRDATVFTRDSDGSFSTVLFPQGDVSGVRVTAMELIAGQTVEAQ